MFKKNGIVVANEIDRSRAGQETNRCAGQSMQAPTMLGRLGRRYVAASLLALGLTFGHQAFAALGVSVTIPAGQPTDIYPGEITQLQITISNNNESAPITGTAFSNSLPGTLPNGLRIAGAFTYTCAEGGGEVGTAGSVTASGGTQHVALTGGTIPVRTSNVDGSCTITIPVTAGTSDGLSATYNYQIAAGAVTGNDGASVSNVGAVSQSVNVRALTRPTISKNFNSGTLVLGGAATRLTITVSNSNPVPIAGFTVTDPLPDTIRVANPPNASATCTAGGTDPAVTAAAGAASVSASSGTLPANGICTIEVDVVGHNTADEYSDTRQNRIDRSSGFTNELGIRAEADATRNITVRSPLRVTKAFLPTQIAAGQAGSVTITLFNDGSTPLTITTFDDSPIDGVGGVVADRGLVVTSVENTCGGSATILSPDGVGRGVRLTGGTIPANGSCTVTANFNAFTQADHTPVTYTNEVVEDAVGISGSDIVSQAASATILVSDTLRVLKANLASAPRPGEPVRYRVTVQNWSTSGMSNVQVVDALPGGLTYLTGTLGDNDYSPTLTAACGPLETTNATGDTGLTFTIPMIPARSSDTSPGACVLEFYAMVPAGAAAGLSTANTIDASAVCTDAGSGICNGGAATSENRAVVANVLAMTKSFTPAGPLPEGSVTRMRIALQNFSANPLTALTISDTLPIGSEGSQMQIANPANAATTCGGSIVTGANSIELNGGSIAARADAGSGAAGSCFLEVDVVGAAGTYTNTANAAATRLLANGTSTTVSTDATAPITFNSSLTASKSFSPAVISEGGRSTVRITLNNGGSVALTNVWLSDPLPAGMVVADPSNAYTTCAGSTEVTAVAGASQASLAGASIIGNGNCDFIFDVTATGPTNWVNTIPAGNITAAGGIRNITPITATLTRQAPQGLTVAKQTDPSTLTFPGQVSRLTITITNGTQAVTGLSLTDHFTNDGLPGGTPNGMVVASTAAAATSCPGGIPEATPGAISAGVSGVSLAANASCTLSLNVTSTVVGGITNVIPPSAIRTDQGLTNSNQATTSLTTASNIGITKQFTPNVVEPGDRSRLRITLFNPGSQPAANVSLTDVLPVGVIVPPGPNPVTNCLGGTVSTPVPGEVHIAGVSLPAASGGTVASCFAEIDVLVSAQGDYVNTIPAGALSGSVGGITVTNSQPASDTLRASLPLEIQKAIDNRTLDSTIQPGSGFSTDAATAAPGQVRALTIRLRNPNNVAITGLGFTDTLPANLVVAPTPNAATTCTDGTVFAGPSATSVRLAGATVGANSACTVTVDVLSNISGSYLNEIDAGAVSSEQGVTNAEPTRARLVVSTPPTVGKQFEPAVIPAGGTSRLTIFLGNANESNATLSSALIDTLPIAPGNIMIAATPGVDSTCTGAVTATAGSGEVRLANGSTIPPGGCSISVNVTGNVAGDYTNVIAAAALQTDLGNNPQPAVAPLSVSSLGFISGRVFLDNNLLPNGTFEPGVDSGLPGVSIELRSGADCGGALVGTTTTDALGNYLFTGLSADTYSVCQPVQPAGTLNGATTAGAIVANNGSTGTSGNGSNPTATSSQITNIVLNDDGGSGEISGSSGNNFAEIVPSRIEGIVFLDNNNNGVQNGGEPGIAGVTITLTGTDHLGNTVSLSTDTDANGGYVFDGLRPGTYTVTQPAQPAGTANGITSAGTVPNGGTQGTPTTLVTLPSAISNIILPPNTTASGNNFAEIPNTRTISGVVFLDYDNNGLLDGVDHGIGGVALELTGTDINGNPVTRTTTTLPDGTYAFTDVPEGTYTVIQPDQPAGTTNGIPTAGSTGGTATNPTATSSQISSISLVGGDRISALNNFAELPGAAPDLTIRKTHSPASFAAGSSTGFYTITVSNLSPVAPSSGTVTVVDTLPAGIAPLAAFGSGWTCSISGQTVTCATDTVIGVSADAPAITLRVTVDTGLVGQILINTVTVSGGGEPPGFAGNNTAIDPTPISEVASLSGSVWRDLNHDRVRDPGEPGVAGWRVELVLGSTVVATALTDADGQYAISNVSPGSGYQLRFVEPSTGQVFGSAVPNEGGLPVTDNVRDDPAAPVTTNAGNPAGAALGDGTLRNLTLFAGDNIVEQSLPLDPAGVVYDAVTRHPVAGAVVTVSGPAGFDPQIHLVGGNASVTTGADGFYQFLLTPSAPAGEYVLAITTFPAGYLPQPSQIIPVCTNTLSVGSIPNPALVQSSDNPPGAGAPLHDQATCPSLSSVLSPANQASTQYFFRFNIDPTTSADVLNNHIPLDPVLGGAIRIVKTTPLVNVTKGEPVPYTITATNTLGVTLTDVDLVDQIPPGFRYRSSSASIRHGGSEVFVPVEPTVSGRMLTWPSLTFAPGEEKTVRLVLMVGAGVGEGEYTNLAWAMNSLAATRISNVGEATVRIIPDPLFDCSDIIGQVFDDRNANGYQDDGEPGIPNVRVVTARGLLVTTDAEGRFHVRCADIPQRDRGSNFVMKLDERTLPSGYRITTENPRDVRTTRGKMVKLNFGATIHKVFRIEVDGRAFDTDNRLLPAWTAQLAAVVPQMQMQPSVARLAYVTDGNAGPEVEKQLRQLESDLLRMYREQVDNRPPDIPPLIVEREEIGVMRGAEGGVR